MVISPRSLRLVALALFCGHVQSFIAPRYLRSTQQLDLRWRLASKLHGAASANELQPLTVPALKELCRARGLKVGGTKADLIARLEDSGSEAVGDLSLEAESASGAAAAAPADAEIGAPGLDAVEAVAPTTPIFPSGSSEHTYTRAVGDTAQAVGFDADLLHDLISTREVQAWHSLLWLQFRSEVLISLSHFNLLRFKLALSAFSITDVSLGRSC